jgi:hypothetical protein
MTKRIRTGKCNQRAAETDKAREQACAAPNMIGWQKTKADLDAEADAVARAEALLKKAQSKFYSLE